VALEPARNFSLTVDWYAIDIEDRIVFSENFTGTDIQQLFASSGLTGVTGGRFFTNAIDTRTRGLDVVANYAADFRARGLLRLTAGYNRNRTNVVSVIPTPAQLGNRGEALFGRVERSRIEIGQPRDNVLASATYDWRRLTLVTRTQRFGAVTSLNPLGANGQPVATDQTFAAKWITDVSAGVRLPARVTLTVGADNVADVYPDRNSDFGDPRVGAVGAAGPAGRAGNANFGIFPYNGISPFGFNGRFVYARANVTF
jgi:iron complex outermembrane receptor protein